jgi:hypothetical protein
LAFSSVDDPTQKELNTPSDPIREVAYMDLDAVLRGGKDSQGIRHEGNHFLRFPRLNEVLPLPPKEVTQWEGIYSAMSPNDAAYYQDPLPAEHYIGEIREAGYLIPDDYLIEPVPLTFDE